MRGMRRQQRVATTVCRATTNETVYAHILARETEIAARMWAHETPQQKALRLYEATREATRTQHPETRLRKGR